MPAETAPAEIRHIPAAKDAPPRDAAARIVPHEMPPPPVPAGEPLWVFGYGSLMWNPGFPHSRAEPAVVRGYHRGFCIHSHHYRGTPERPGLVLGLDRGGTCRGIAFHVEPADVPEAAEYLWRREMIDYVYIPTMVSIRRTCGSTHRAYAFVVNREHGSYVGDLPEAEAAAIIRRSAGVAGTNRDYLANTVRHLDELGLGDKALARLLALVEAGRA
ncbi:MAG TPA: gamma-glutamylcyclotransferase [Alphaproteobacteria bacterium]|nr:gamma-glutamylcyclotransferase [Alphaproteobacteria bacterium]